MSAPTAIIRVFTATNITTLQTNIANFLNTNLISVDRIKFTNSSQSAQGATITYTYIIIYI